MSRTFLFPLAGFQVTFNGRFWVTAEEPSIVYPKMSHESYQSPWMLPLVSVVSSEEEGIRRETIKSEDVRLLYVSDGPIDSRLNPNLKEMVRFLVVGVSIRMGGPRALS